MTRVLIVEDQKDLAAVLAENLAAEGYLTRTAHLIATARDLVDDWRPDLVVLDLILPDGSGEAILRHVRRGGLMIPILILSARGDERTKVKGLRQGADDFVTKPFGLMEFLARVDSLLRRTHGNRLPDRVVFGAVEVDPRARRVTVDGVEAPLRPREMDLLLALVARKNEAVARGTLLAEVWGYSADAQTRTIDWHMGELRRKLEPDPGRPRHLRTVRGVGYRLDTDPAPEGC